MIYDYVNTKPPLEEVYGELEHGWLKNAVDKVSKKAHKYLKRWKDEYGRWRYQYYVKKNKKIEQDVKDAKDKYHLTGVTRDARSYGKVLKQRKQWNKSGRKKVYRQRKKQIIAGRANARKGWSNNSYRVRKDKIASARSNAKKAYTDKITNANYNAYKGHNMRKSQISNSRGMTKYKKELQELDRRAQNSQYWKIRKEATSARKRRKLK